MAIADVFRPDVMYSSGAARVVGFLIRPRAAAGIRYPLLVYNRGGFGDIGKIDTWNLIDFYGFAARGFVVVASQYRGNDGGTGSDEVGGADVDDVLRLAAIARRMKLVDTNNVFVYGLSRGAIETFRGLNRGLRANAAAVVGGVYDLKAFGSRSPGVLRMVGSRMPRYDANPDSVLIARSAMAWPDSITVPLLLIHGTEDDEVPATEALAFASKLQGARKVYQLIVYANDIHEAARHHLERDRADCDMVSESSTSGNTLRIRAR